MYREFEIYDRIGFSNAEILQCVTINNARILGMEDQIGTIEAGKLADLVVFENNPLQDIKALRKPTMVFKDGRIMHATAALNRVQANNT
ncbi:MAG: amidohydrolase family protein [Thermodesulfobacteriota bacterium]|nr:amidohydrolase family protein [Thermodesulfobacteriota bacterium]